MSPPIATKAVPATAAAIESTPSTTVALPKPEARFATTPIAGCTAPRSLGPKLVSAGPKTPAIALLTPPSLEAIELPKVFKRLSLNSQA